MAPPPSNDNGSDNVQVLLAHMDGTLMRLAQDVRELKEDMGKERERRESDMLTLWKRQDEMKIWQQQHDVVAATEKGEKIGERRVASTVFVVSQGLIVAGIIYICSHIIAADQTNAVQDSRMSTIEQELHPERIEGHK